MTRGIAGIAGFLEKARAHVSGTGKDKYAQDRKHEPADVLSEWFPESPLLWNAGKYLSRLPRTKKESDFFKAIHYIGMEYNRVFGKPRETPVEMAGLEGSLEALSILAIEQGQNRFGWEIPKPTEQTATHLRWLIDCLFIFDERHKRRGPMNINAIGFEGCMKHVEEKRVRALEAFRQLQEVMAENPKRDDWNTRFQAIWKDLWDSLVDIANFSLIGGQLAEGTWPPNPSVQTTGSPV